MRSSPFNTTHALYAFDAKLVVVVDERSWHPIPLFGEQKTCRLVTRGSNDKLTAYDF